MKKQVVVFGLTLAALSVIAISATQLVLAAPPAKVLICHVDPDCDGDGPHVISISERALEAHLRHGDCDAPEEAEVGDACPDLEECEYPECD